MSRGCVLCHEDVHFGMGMIIMKTAKRKPIDQIADEMEVDIEFIRPMYDAVIANPGKSAEEIYRLML